MSDRPKSVLVVVDVDPAESDQATEALRMSLGLAAASNEVRVVCRRGRPNDPRAVGFLEALERLGARVETTADPMLSEADAVIRWTAGELNRRLRHGDDPGLALGASPDAEGLLDTILEHERVAIW